MDRADLVLAGLATDNCAPLTPVQAQKLFFLLDQCASNLDGPHWNFAPYDYGPFDAGVYREMESLAREGLVSIRLGGVRCFLATDEGARRGKAALASLPADTRSYVEQLGHWVRSLTFPQLVSAIYQAFPDMRANSKFVG
ncbi:MAG: hypothetical protein IT373_11965 [Polyangiaceae bacterium]|nr:hypothetical protein [Polyangiaceae bacterium]